MAIQRNVTNGAIAAAILVAIVGALYGQSEYLGGYYGVSQSRAPPHARYMPGSASATRQHPSFSGRRDIGAGTFGHSPASVTRSSSYSPYPPSISRGSGAPSPGMSRSQTQQPSLSRAVSVSGARPGILGTVGGAPSELGGSTGSGNLGGGN